MPTYTDTALAEDLQKAVELLDHDYIPSAKIYHNFRMYTIKRSNCDDKLYLLYGSKSYAEACGYGWIAVKIFYDAIIDIEKKERNLTFDIHDTDANDEIDEDDISEYLTDRCPFELGDILEIKPMLRDEYGRELDEAERRRRGYSSVDKKVTVKVVGITFSVEEDCNGDICNRWKILMRSLDEGCVSEYVGTFTDNFYFLEIFPKWSSTLRFEIVSYLGTMNHGNYIYAKPGVYNYAVVHDVKSLHPSMWEGFGDGDIPDVEVKIGPYDAAVAIKISKPGSEEEEE